MNELGLLAPSNIKAARPPFGVEVFLPGYRFTKRGQPLFRHTKSAR